MGKRPHHPEKWDQVCQSIGSYLEVLKKNYGAEPVLFSFNESDMGVNVLQSPQEHADAIKRLGACFAARGLKTRMLLGDTGNPTGDKFIDVALADPEAAKYIGAVSFHSWNGGTVGQYTHFGEAARRLNVPLLVAEGGLDPAAWHYRNLFLEPWYGLDEIAQYVEICRIAQPLSILHWQLTADYSILAGGIDGQPFNPRSDSGTSNSWHDGSRCEHRAGQLRQSEGCRVRVCRSRSLRAASGQQRRGPQGDRFRAAGGR